MNYFHIFSSEEKSLILFVGVIYTNAPDTAKILKTLRETRGLSQQQVAEALNITRTAYVKYETGASNPTRKLKELAKFYNVPIDYILGNDQQQEQFDLQMFGKKNVPEANFALAFGKILTLKDEKAKDLTLQIMKDVIQLSIPQLEAISALIKTMKQ